MSDNGDEKPILGEAAGLRRDLDNVSANFENMCRRMDTLNDSVSELVDRQKSAEAKINAGERGGERVQKRDDEAGKLDQAGKLPTTVNNTESLADYSETSELQGAYTAIKDSVVKVILPPHLTLGDIGAPAKGADTKKQMALIRKSGGYVTTAMKVLKTVSSRGNVLETDRDTTYTVLLAHFRMLQSEQSVCVVEGTGVTADCVRMYRFLSKNPCFSQTETIAMENAARMSVAASLAQKTEPTRGGHGRGYGGGRFGGRFNNRGGGNQRGYGAQGGNRDAFDNAVNQAATKP
jgi:hypothetical protein